VSAEEASGGLRRRRARAPSPNGDGVELLYELPREVWEGDIDAALNFAEQLPTEGSEAPHDRTEVRVFKPKQSASV
jgi:hypothetical protein